MKKFFLMMTLCVAVFSAYAQSNKAYDDLVAALKQAATEQDDSARLALYDAIVHSLGVVTIGQTPKVLRFRLHQSGFLIKKSILSPIIRNISLC